MIFEIVCVGVFECKCTNSQEVCKYSPMNIYSAKRLKLFIQHLFYFNFDITLLLVLIQNNFSLYIVQYTLTLYNTHKNYTLYTIQYTLYNIRNKI